MKASRCDHCGYRITGKPIIYPPSPQYHGPAVFCSTVCDREYAESMGGSDDDTCRTEARQMGITALD